MSNPISSPPASGDYFDHPALDHSQNPRSGSAAGSPSPQSALVERARVITVDVREWTVDIRTEHTHKTRLRISWGTPYCHQSNGEGINFVPEVGSTCWVCSPSEENRESFVLAWTMPEDGKGKYRNGREFLNPGDIHLSTRDGNFVWLRRGGVVQIGSTPICQRIYLPIRNIIKDVFENYEMLGVGGEMLWQVFREDEDGDGHKRTLFTLNCREFSDDPIKDPLAVLKIGSHGDGNSTILSLVTRDKGGGAIKTNLEISKTGDITWKMNKMTLNVDTDLAVMIGGKGTVEAKTGLELKGGSTALLQGENTTVEGGGGAKLSLGSGKSSLSGEVSLSDTAQHPVLRASPDMLTWIDTVNAALAVAGPVSGVPALAKPTTHTNAKVKV